MSLPTAYLVTTKNLEAFLNALKTAKAPDRVHNKFLQNLEFLAPMTASLLASSNRSALLATLAFLQSDTLIS